MTWPEVNSDCGYSPARRRDREGPEIQNLVESKEVSTGGSLFMCDIWALSQCHVTLSSVVNSAVNSVVNFVVNSVGNSAVNSVVEPLYELLHDVLHTLASFGPIASNLDIATYQSTLIEHPCIFLGEC